MRWRIFAIILAAAWLASANILAQEESGDPGLAADESTTGGDSLGADDGLGADSEDSGSFVGSEGRATDLAAIEDLLAQDETTRSDDADSFTYDPGTRRDPFRSLLEARNSQIEEIKERPEGKAGLLIDEIVVEGVFQLADGPVVQVQAAHQNTSFLLRPGDQLWDGDVISITLEEVVFKQLVNDPTALKPFREVVKRLNP